MVQNYLSFLEKTNKCRDLMVVCFFAVVYLILILSNTMLEGSGIVHDAQDYIKKVAIVTKAMWHSRIGRKIDDKEICARSM